MEGNANPRAGKTHLTQLLLFRVVLNVPSSGCLRRHQHVHAGETPRPGLARHSICVGSSCSTVASSLHTAHQVNAARQCSAHVERTHPHMTGEPWKVSHSQRLACSVGYHMHFIPVQCRCVTVGVLLLRICLGWSFPSGWQSRRTPRLKGDNAGSTVLSPALPRLHGLQIYSSDQLRQCWMPSRHSLLGTQEQYS